MSSPSPFRSFLFQLSERLDSENLEAIRFVYELPASFDTALKILCKLETQGIISASEPAKLEELFKSINRIDLARRVKEYTKLQKKKKSASKLNDDLQISSCANVEVALTQARLLRDQIEYILAENILHQEQTRVILEVRKKSEELQNMLQSVKAGQQQATDSSSESDSTISPPDSINRKLSEALQKKLVAAGSSKKMQCLRRSTQDHESSPPPRYPLHPLLPPTNKAPRFSQEESNASTPMKINLVPQPLAEREVAPSTTSEPSNPNINDGSSLLVTGTISKQKPKPPPKPKKLQRTQSKEMLESETEPDKAKTEENKDENRTEKDDRDESGYAGTGDDQEFTDPLQFLKTSPGSPPPPPPPPSSTEDIYETSPGYYKPIQRQTVQEVSYYKLPLKQKKQQGSKDERIYENSSATSHNTL